MLVIILYHKNFHLAIDNSNLLTVISGVYYISKDTNKNWFMLKSALIVIMKIKGLRLYSPKRTMKIKWNLWFWCLEKLLCKLHSEC